MINFLVFYQILDNLLKKMSKIIITKNNLIVNQKIKMIVIEKKVKMMIHKVFI